MAIDGLRAWMAWTVVFSHIVEQAFATGLDGAWTRFDLGGQAVYTFIIISGFVITHLLIERSSNYAAYIVPRFMRLFPALLAACAIGAAAYLIARKYGDATWFEAVHGQGYRALALEWPRHALAHATMLHGLIPNTLLPYSQYALVPPGWSVSLEWQFYLIAPGVLWLSRTRAGAVGLVAAVVAMSIAYHAGLSDLWGRPSMIFGAAKWFLIGIACRFAAPALAERVEYVAAIGLGLAFTMAWLGTPALAIWLMVYSFMLRRNGGARGIDRSYIAVMTACLESRPLLWLAERSYSTYLLHWPLIMLVGAGATAAGVAPGLQLAVAMLVAIPLTLLVQEPIYRFVEVPGRALGRQWARRLNAIRPERPAQAARG